MGLFRNHAPRQGKGRRLCSRRISRALRESMPPAREGIHVTPDHHHHPSAAAHTLARGHRHHLVVPLMRPTCLCLPLCSLPGTGPQFKTGSNNIFSMTRSQPLDQSVLLYFRARLGGRFFWTHSDYRTILRNAREAVRSV